AVVIAQRLYRMNLNLFEEVYLHSNADLKETIRAIQIRVFTQPGQDPYDALYPRGGGGPPQLPRSRSASATRCSAIAYAAVRNVTPFCCARPRTPTPPSGM